MRPHEYASNIATSNTSFNKRSSMTSSPGKRSVPRSETPAAIASYVSELFGPRSQNEVSLHNSKKRSVARLMPSTAYQGSPSGKGASTVPKNGDTAPSSTNRPTRSGCVLAYEAPNAVP